MISTAGKESPAPTHFAPGERYSADELAPMVKKLIEDPVIRIILGSIPGSVLILNSKRQILTGNKEILDSLGLKEAEPLIGLRPGEALSCIHSGEGPSGCGTSVSCRSCGAVLTMLAALETGKPVKGECAISVRESGKYSCLNLDFHAVPVEIGGMGCLEIVFHDVSEQKMRELLDRIFFHDLRNAMNGLIGWSEIFAMDEQTSGGGGRASDMIAKLGQGIMRMLDEHAVLMAAESGELSTEMRPVEVGGIVGALADQLSLSSISARRMLELLPGLDGSDEVVVTDPDLLGRVLLNMAKNAFEATNGREPVTVGFGRDSSGRPFFTVHNPGAIPEEVRPKVFQRAFSTKGGMGRGLGTYGMKLLGENWLHGEVEFESSPEEGTTFRITLPL